MGAPFKSAADVQTCCTARIVPTRSVGQNVVGSTFVSLVKSDCRFVTFLIVATTWGSVSSTVRYVGTPRARTAIRCSGVRRVKKHTVPNAGPAKNAADVMASFASGMTYLHVMSVVYTVTPAAKSKRGGTVSSLTSLRVISVGSVSVVGAVPSNNENIVVIKLSVLTAAPGRRNASLVTLCIVIPKPAGPPTSPIVPMRREPKLWISRTNHSNKTIVWDPTILVID